MNNNPGITKQRIAIVGGGPGGLFMYKRLVESGRTDLEIDIFEKKEQLGTGMPYSREGANDEHITNVSGNEIPELVSSIKEWIKQVPAATLQRFDIDLSTFHDYKVLPRLLFGEYLSAQFTLLQQKGKEAGLVTRIHYNSMVTDITDQPGTKEVWLTTGKGQVVIVDTVIICTGHNWPVKHEGVIPGYYDAPYPPAKLALKVNHPVAIKGASLTAIDAVRTLARSNGSFVQSSDGKLSYTVQEDSAGFKLVMHSLDGLLPAVRFHLEDPHLSKEALLTPAEIAAALVENDGFLPLDLVFEKNFKDLFRDKEPEFYQRIKHLSMEEFVTTMMELRERLDAFQLFRAEYAEAEQSIKRKESVYWKEMLAVLSFTMNYPAKYLSAEDMGRLKKVLMPLIAIVIAFVPQSSARELLALHEAGILELVPVGPDSRIEPGERGGIQYHYIEEGKEGKTVPYKMFIDCVGQPHLSLEEFPFKSLVINNTVTKARLKFRSAAAGKAALEAGDKEVEKGEGEVFYRRVPGIAINDHFQVVDAFGAGNERVFIMAVPYIGGYNPDYSGLDFSEAASARVVNCILGCV